MILTRDKVRDKTRKELLRLFVLNKEYDARDPDSSLIGYCQPTENDLFIFYDDKSEDVVWHLEFDDKPYSFTAELELHPNMPKAAWEAQRSATNDTQWLEPAEFLDLYEKLNPSAPVIPSFTIPTPVIETNLAAWL